VVKTIVAISGRPNTGKTTLFNALTGLGQRVANFAGCTVERAVGNLEKGDDSIEIVDLPGTHSLSALSQDEEIAFRFLEETAQREGAQGRLHVMCVCEASNLAGDLALAEALNGRGYSVIVVINMMDEARQNGIIIDIARLSKELQVPVFPASARYGEGIPEIRAFIESLVAKASKLQAVLSRVGSSIKEEQEIAFNRAQRAIERSVRLPDGGLLSTISRSMRIDRWLFHPLIGPLILTATLFLVFESLFSLGRPLSDALSSLFASGSNFFRGVIPGEFLSSLFCDGILAGISAVATFIPQIAILFLLIGFLEQSGYLPRAGVMLDRAFRPFGLDGKVFIPFLSSFACAIPGVMAARTIANEKRRLAAIFLCPLMTCSARIPVYTLIIAAFVPATLRFFGLSAQALVMAGMYGFGILVALLFALVLKLGGARDDCPLPLTVLPPYRLPHLREMAIYVWVRSAHFLRKAGRVIFTVSLVLWVMASFPKNPESRPIKVEIAWLHLSQNLSADSKTLISSLEVKAQALDAETSLLSRVGKIIEPVFKPIGYDWRISVAVIASLTAREVFVGTLGTLFSVSGDREPSRGLVNAIRNARTPDGLPAYGIPTAVSLLIFFAIALQCLSTVIVVRRETGGWKWPVIQFSSFFFVAYSLSWAGFHLASHLIH
jgi:ferrous iron transport protein B